MEIRKHKKTSVALRALRGERLSNDRYPNRRPLKWVSRRLVGPGARAHRAAGCSADHLGLHTAPQWFTARVLVRPPMPVIARFLQLPGLWHLQCRPRSVF